MKPKLLLGAGLAALAVGACAQAAPAPLPPAGTQVVVTVLASHDEPVPKITAAQVQVRQGHDQDAVTGWEQPSGADARLDLVLVIDDDTQNLGSRLDDIKAFINALPSTTAIGLVYMRTGGVSIAQAFTLDHAQAVKALRMPSGGSVSPSPFGSLQALMSKWPRHPNRRREMILLSDGEEHLGGNDSNNVTFQKAVADTVEGGVVAYTIFVSGESALPSARSVSSTGDSSFPAVAGAPLGATGRGFASMNTAAIQAGNGSVNLGLLAESTGGQAYAEGSGTPARLTPYLDDIARCLQSQYLLTFTPAPSSHSGLTEVKIEVKRTPAKIIVPKQIFLPNS